MKKRLFVDVHCLQTVPPSCVNRDDTGTPKTAVYGGVNRSRVSSQAWKRAMRKEFATILPAEEVGTRTKKIVGMVQKEIKNIISTSNKPEISDQKTEKMATEALKNAGLKIKGTKEGTDALLLMSKKQAEALAQLAVNEVKDKDEYKKALRENPSVDMALFGRMVAADPSLNYDAAAQVAHAISTHAVVNEYDYFTAVDDLGDEDSAGAGHVGVSEYNSSTLYRYATVNVMELYRTIGLETPEAVRAFIKAFVMTMPSGKQNSYANQTIPCSVYVSIRQDQPVSFAGAFEEAIPATSKGFEHASQEKLVEYAKKVTEFVEEPFAAYVSGEGLQQLAGSKPFTEVLDDVEKDLTELLPGGEA